MVGLNRVFVDTSVLLAGTMDLGDSSVAPFGVMDAVAAGAIEHPLTAWHCCLELYSVATRLPEEYRLQPADARRILDEEVLARFTVCDLPATARADLLAAAAAGGIAGGRIYDAHIAEAAHHAGATIVVTENRRHFTLLLRHGIRVLSAAELAAELPDG